jgi:hypothetical protein
MTTGAALLTALVACIIVSAILMSLTDGGPE